MASENLPQGSTRRRLSQPSSSRIFPMAFVLSLLMALVLVSYGQGGSLGCDLSQNHVLVGSQNLRLLGQMRRLSLRFCLQDRKDFAFPQEMVEGGRLQEAQAISVLHEMLQQSFNLFHTESSSAAWDTTLLEQLRTGLHQQLDDLDACLGQVTGEEDSALGRTGPTLAMKSCNAICSRGCHLPHTHSLANRRVLTLLRQLRRVSPSSCLQDRKDFAFPQEALGGSQLQKAQAISVLHEVTQHTFQLFSTEGSAAAWDQSLLDKLRAALDQQLTDLQACLRQEAARGSPAQGGLQPGCEEILPQSHSLSAREGTQPLCLGGCQSRSHESLLFLNKLAGEIQEQGLTHTWFNTEVILMDQQTTLPPALPCGRLISAVIMA
ncbi:hypothetical protein R6Z07F_002574 [Ovis aries]